MIIPRPLIIALTVLTLAGSVQVAHAQDAPFCGGVVASLPAGATLNPLACVETFGAGPNPSGTWTLQLSRVELGPGQSIAPRVLPLDEHTLLYVESGELTLFDPVAQRDSAVLAGEQRLLEASSGVTSFAIRNDGTAPLIYLRLTWFAPPPAPPDAVERTADGPVDRYPRVGNSTPQTLADMTVDADQIPAGSVLAFVARLQLAPGVALGDRVYAGPVAEAIELGALTVLSQHHPSEDDTSTAEPSILPLGQAVTIPQGQYLVVPTNTPHQASNAESDPTSVLIAGLIPATDAPSI